MNETSSYLCCDSSRKRSLLRLTHSSSDKEICSSVDKSSSWIPEDTRMLIYVIYWKPERDRRTLKPFFIRRDGEAGNMEWLNRLPGQTPLDKQYWNWMRNFSNLILFTNLRAANEKWSSIRPSTNRNQHEALAEENDSFRVCPSPPLSHFYLPPGTTNCYFVCGFNYSMSGEGEEGDRSTWGRSRVNARGIDGDNWSWRGVICVVSLRHHEWCQAKVKRCDLIMTNAISVSLVRSIKFIFIKTATINRVSKSLSKRFSLYTAKLKLLIKFRSKKIQHQRKGSVGGLFTIDRR